MKKFYPTSNLDDIRKCISGFVYDEGLCQLIESFGGKYTGKTLSENLEYLLKFSDIWDYRKSIKTKTENNESARWLISNETLSERQRECITVAKKTLGLVDNANPDNEYYDYIWVLGGAKLSCLLRTQLAKEISCGLKTKPKKIALLGSFRPINISERVATDTYAPDADSEFDLFIYSYKNVFGKHRIRFEQEGGAQNNKWKIIEYEDNISILAAPSLDPDNRRANSLDTYLFFIDKYKVQPLTSILIVTSEIYVPYQHLEAYRLVALNKNVRVETVGFSLAKSGQLHGMNSDENFLQEIRSTVQSYSKLAKAVEI